MNKKSALKIESWVRTNFSKATPKEGISRHVDELSGEVVNKSEYVTLFTEMFEIVINVLLPLGLPARPLLVIPLTCGTTHLQRNYPQDLEELLNDLHELEPPSIYLLNWESWELEKAEEFRCPISFNFINLKNLYSYYREYRYLEAIKSNWEFSRTVYVTCERFSSSIS